jgi:hypothetical protein
MRGREGGSRTQSKLGQSLILLHNLDTAGNLTEPAELRPATSVTTPDSIPAHPDRSSPSRSVLSYELRSRKDFASSINLADQESATAEGPTREEGRTRLGGLTSPLLLNEPAACPCVEQHALPKPRDGFLRSPRDVDRGVEGPLDEAAKFALGDGRQGVEYL